MTLSDVLRNTAFIIYDMFTRKTDSEHGL